MSGEKPIWNHAVLGVASRCQSSRLPCHHHDRGDAYEYVIYYQPVYGGAADAFLAWKDGAVIDPGMGVALVANPWRIDQSSMDILMQNGSVVYLECLF